MLLNYTESNRQSEAGSFSYRLGCIKRIKDSVDFSGRNAVPCIENVYNHLIKLHIIVCWNGDHTFSANGIKSVVYQVYKSLLKFFLIPHNSRQTRSQPTDKGNPIKFKGMLYNREYVFYGIVDIKRFHAAFGATGESEQVCDNLFTDPGLFFYYL